MRIASDTMIRPTNAISKPLELKNIHKIEDFVIRKQKQVKKSKDQSNPIA